MRIATRTYLSELRWASCAERSKFGVTQNYVLCVKLFWAVGCGVKQKNDFDFVFSRAAAMCVDAEDTESGAICLHDHEVVVCCDLVALSQGVCWVQSGLLGAIWLHGYGVALCGAIWLHGHEVAM